MLSHDATHKAYIVFALFSAQNALSFFKVALKMLGKIASQLLNSENESCPPRTAVMAVLLSEVTSDATLGTRGARWPGD